MQQQCLGRRRGQQAQLGRHRRPLRVGVALPQIQTRGAGRGAGRQERAHPHAHLPHDHRQVSDPGYGQSPGPHRLDQVPLDGDDQIGERPQGHACAHGRVEGVRPCAQLLVLRQQRAHPGFGEQGDEFVSQPTAADDADDAAAQRLRAHARIVGDAFPVDLILARGRRGIASQDAGLVKDGHEFAGASDRHLAPPRHLVDVAGRHARRQTVEELLLLVVQPIDDDGVARFGADLRLAEASPQYGGLSSDSHGCSRRRPVREDCRVTRTTAADALAAQWHGAAVVRHDSGTLWKTAIAR